MLGYNWQKKNIINIIFSSPAVCRRPAALVTIDNSAKDDQMFNFTIFYEFKKSKIREFSTYMNIIHMTQTLYKNKMQYINYFPNKSCTMWVYGPLALCTVHSDFHFFGLALKAGCPPVYMAMAHFVCQFCETLWPWPLTL